MALSSINGVGAHTARAPFFNQCVGVRGRTLRAANHPKIVTIRALYRDPMPLSDGAVKMLCSLTMYLSRSSLFTILLYRSSILWMAECRDSAPCSPIRPAPTCHRLSHGITWSSIICILGKTVARGNSCW